jgi:hypothetical protein
MRRPIPYFKQAANRGRLFSGVIEWHSVAASAIEVSSPFPFNATFRV